MPHLRELNNHNTAKKNGYFLGHSNNFATLSVHVLAAVPHHNAAIVPTMQPLDPEAMKLIFSKQR